jgi:4-hydroxy-tetrahydrodipicolinate reductase
MIRVIVAGACGRMGRMIVEGIAEQGDMELVGAIARPGRPQIGRDIGEVAGVGTLGVPVSSDLPASLSQGDVVIEFTRPSVTIEHLRHTVEMNKPMAIGTTGFTKDELAEVRELAVQIPCVMASNMSMGVNILSQAIALAANMLGDDYDVEVIETHHNQKVDSPSGTALRLAEGTAEVLGRQLPEVSVYGRHGIIGHRSEKEIGVHAIRGGDLAGNHTVLFANADERIEITHHSHSREAYANGAIRAAKWVVNAPKGLHDINEVFV